MIFRARNCEFLLKMEKIKDVQIFASGVIFGIPFFVSSNLRESAFVYFFVDSGYFLFEKLKYFSCLLKNAIQRRIRRNEIHRRLSDFERNRTRRFWASSSRRKERTPGGDKGNSHALQNGAQRLNSILFLFIFTIIFSGARRIKTAERFEAQKCCSTLRAFYLRRAQTAVHDHGIHPRPRAFRHHVRRASFRRNY